MSPPRAPWVLLLAAGCGGAVGSSLPSARPVPPDGDGVEAVLFLIGDAGDRPRAEAPVLHRLRADVEAWSGALARDSAVAVLFLGDNVYPEGVRPRTDPAFPADSARLEGQIWTVSGPSARRYSTRGLFLPGNHDWGNARGPDGRARLEGEEALLEAFARTGAPVTLVPPAGTPGPVAIDLGARVRVLALDTHWWLQGPPTSEKSVFAGALREALGDARGRTLVVAAHHPVRSAGEHGDVLWTGPDPYWLLRRAGALVQDVNSGPYRELVDTLRAAFARGGEPLVYAAGHDHSLQLLRAVSPGEPTWSVVSGAGSKRDGLGRSEALAWSSGEPGYMRLVIRRDGGVDLFAETAPPDQAVCEGEAEALARCVADGVAAFRTTFSARLR